MTEPVPRGEVGLDLAALLEHERALMTTAPLKAAKTRRQVMSALRSACGKRAEHRERARLAGILKLEWAAVEADRLDEGQASGEISSDGRPDKTVSSTNSFPLTVEEAVGSRYEAFLIRRIRDVVRSGEHEHLEEPTDAEALRLWRAWRTQAREQAASQAASAPAPALTNLERFPILYADPPWRYEDAEPSRKVENNYPTMTIEDIWALEPPAADDSVLLLWATSPKLAEAIATIDCWDFEYRTSMVWVKDRIGMGYYARQRHELLLIARRGDLPVPTPSRRPDSVITAPRGAHSEKPLLHDLIDRMWPGLPKVEMFARRQLDRPGWTTWGNAEGLT